METFQAKSVIVSRKPGKKEDTWAITIALFSENNPHLKGRVPSQVIEYKEIEKVRIRELKNVSFYSAGNDLVINDLIKMNLNAGKGIITLTGKQKFRK